MPTLPTYPRAYDSLEVEFFPNAVLYVAPSPPRHHHRHHRNQDAVVCTAHSVGCTCWFRHRYTSAGGTIAVGDPIACEISSPSANGKSACHWVNEELKQEANYE